MRFDSDPIALIGFLADKLGAFKLAYLHVMRSDFYQVQKGDVMAVACEKYTGVLIGNMGYTRPKPNRPYQKASSMRWHLVTPFWPTPTCQSA